MKQRLLKHIIIIVLLIVSVRSFGQQDPMFTQYMNNPQLINPAYAGIYGEMNFNGIFRKQWAGTNIPWTPKTTSLSINTPFKIYQIGLGLDFMHDDVGPLTLTGVFSDYAYHIDFKNNARLSLGLKVGFYYYQEALGGLRTFEYDDLIAAHEVTEKFLFNTGVGIYYQKDNYFLGASVPTLVKNSLVELDNTNVILGRKEQHLFLTGGYTFDLNTLFKLRPTVMFRMVNGSPISEEGTLTAIFNEKVSFGLMYRYGDAIAVHARFEVRDGFQIGYSYDMTTSELSPFNTGTHEIFFSYTIKKQGKRIISPRYF